MWHIARIYNVCVRDFWNDLELVFNTFQSNTPVSLALSAQAEGLRQSLSALYGGVSGVYHSYTIRLSTRLGASAHNSYSSSQMYL